MSACDCQPVGTHEVALLLGVHHVSVRRWRTQGVFAEPDWWVGGRPLWRLETVLAWSDETGRGEL